MQARFKPFEELEFTDDFMFYQVLQDDSICIGLLESLLKVKIERIERRELQKELRPYYDSKGVRLDAYIKDGPRVFNIEMQQVAGWELPKRLRYYQAIMDTDSLLKGSDYADLDESHILFICKNDPIGRGLPVYTFRNTCQEDKGIALGDQANKYFFNAEAAEKENDVAIRAFLSYIKKRKPSDALTDKIDEAVSRIKKAQAEKGVYMIEHLKIRDSIMKGRAEGAQQKAFESAARLIKMNVLSSEQIAQALGLSLQEVLDLQGRLSSP